MYFIRRICLGSLRASSCRDGGTVAPRIGGPPPDTLLQGHRVDPAEIGIELAGEQAGQRLVNRVSTVLEPDQGSLFLGSGLQQNGFAAQPVYSWRGERLVDGLSDVDPPADHLNDRRDDSIAPRTSQNERRPVVVRQDRGGYLPKPYEIDGLLETLRKAYETRMRKKFQADENRMKQIERIATGHSALGILRALRELDGGEK
jgi:hypothetical protein